MSLKNLITISTILIGCYVLTSCESPTKESKPMTEIVEPDSVLRHVVLFQFKDSAAVADVKSVETAFSALPSKIPQILDYEWGLNNSPEGLEKGFTHCFFVTFRSEEDRATYLPHPDHQAFVELLGPFLEDVLVVDYWTN